jgi:hypothetical protein
MGGRGLSRSRHLIDLLGLQSHWPDHPGVGQSPRSPTAHRRWPDFTVRGIMRAFAHLKKGATPLGVLHSRRRDARRFAGSLLFAGCSASATGRGVEGRRLPRKFACHGLRSSRSGVPGTGHPPQRAATPTGERRPLDCCERVGTLTRRRSCRAGLDWGALGRGEVLGVDGRPPSGIWLGLCASTSSHG